jgi:hypothetical protein
MQPNWTDPVGTGKKSIHFDAVRLMRSFFIL